MTSAKLDWPVPSLDEAEWVWRLQAGDCEAYRELVEHYGQTLYSTALRITGDPSDAEDALQETYLSAFQNMASFEKRSSLKTWLTRICINASLCRLRTRARARAASLDQSPPNGRWESRLLSESAENPERSLRGREFRELLLRYLDRLSPALREVFVLRDIEELSSEETARVLGIRVGAVKTRLVRARMTLRTCLAPHLERTDPGPRRPAQWHIAPAWSTKNRGQGWNQVPLPLSGMVISRHALTPRWGCS